MGHLDPRCRSEAKVSKEASEKSVATPMTPRTGLWIREGRPILQEDRPNDQARAASQASISPINAARAPSCVTDSIASPTKAWTSRLSATARGRPRAIR